MFAYWCLFLLVAWRACLLPRPVYSLVVDWPAWWRVIFVVLILMIGLRHEVGADWSNYGDMVKNASYQKLSQAVVRSDPAYGFLNWVGAKTGFGLYFVNTICAVFFCWGLVVFCRAQPRPWLALTVAMPYLVIVVAMGYTRQSAAIGLAMLGLVALSNEKIFRFVLFVALAASFHKSAVILMPLAVLAGTRNKVWTAFWVVLVTLLFYILFLQESVESLTEIYIVAQYDSSGAVIRIAMNALPAVLFLYYHKRFNMQPANKIFWSWMSVAALVFVVLLIVSPSSTAVDRVALYWIPLQLVVLSRLPNALGKRNGENARWVFAVVAYSAMVLFVWLLFATHAKLWLPYQFFPWKLFWS